MQIVQQPAPLADHFEQAAAGAMVLDVALQMLRQMVDALREQGHLHVGRAGVAFMQPEP